MQQSTADDVFIGFATIAHDDGALSLLVARFCNLTMPDSKST
jgi:hypothetical protein